MPQTPLGNIGLEYDHTLGTDDWKNSYDANWVRSDTLGGQAFVNDSQLAAEPGAPAVGDAYILPSGFSGTNWGSDSNAAIDSIALFTDLPGQTDGSPWLYLVPREGWEVFDRTNNFRLHFDGTEWVRINQLNTLRSLGDTLGDYTLSNALDRNVELLITDAFDEANDTIFFDSNANEPFPLGTLIRIVNESGGLLRFTDNAAVTWFNEDPTTWTTGLPNLGSVSFVKVGTNRWWVAHVRGTATFATTLTGFTTTPAITIRYSRVNDHIMLSIPSVSATSNAATMAIAAGLPVFVRPAISQKANCRVTNNSAAAFGSINLPTNGVLAWTNGPGDTLGNFNASNTKGPLLSSVSFLRF